MKILCVGEMLIDFTPVSGLNRTYTANPGGAPANVAISAARNGIEAGFLGKMGNDDFGKLLMKTLEADNVKALIPNLTNEATTTLAFVTLDESGDRSFTFARKPGADLLLNEEDADKVNIDEWDLVHAGSVSQSGAPSKDAVLKVLKRAKAAGKLVSFDINYRDKIWSFEDCKRESEKIYPLADLMKISEEELAFVGGEENIEAFMKEKDVAVLVLTLGGEGARIYFDGKKENIPSMKVPKVVDTTGAGDAFWGGFLSKLLSEGVKKTSDITMDKLIKAAKYGTVSGGLCVQRPGGIPALPTKKEIEENLND